MVSCTCVVRKKTRLDEKERMNTLEEKYKKNK
jgi:hypothetical protein